MNTFLPPANEVWGKVTFLHLHTPPRQTPPLDTTRYGQQAGGIHPTGMHTCSIFVTILPVQR